MTTNHYYSTAQRLRVIGRPAPREVPAPYLHNPSDPYRYALSTPTARAWAGLGPRDCQPFSRSERHRAQLVGLTPLRLRMGEALLDRAPFHLAQLWEGEEYSTLSAYRTLLQLEAPARIPHAGRCRA